MAVGLCNHLLLLTNSAEPSSDHLDHYSSVSPTLKPLFQGSLTLSNMGLLVTVKFTVRFPDSMVGFLAR